MKTIAVLGGGPASSAVALLLARQGRRVALFCPEEQSPQALPVRVGESLVPAVVPYLQALGVEEEVASYSTHKRGACFLFGDKLEAILDFQQGGRDPAYSYNVPRIEFDATLLRAAERAGVTICRREVKLDRDSTGQRLLLDQDSIDATGDTLSGQPDLFIDGSGRKRVVSRVLDLPTRRGPRQDVALFAHVDRAPLLREGNVHTERLRHGWSWRIPVLGRVSIGIVVPESVVSELGQTPEEQFDGLVATDPVLAKALGESRRVTQVQRFANYQLVTERAVGGNWALLGDAAGFVDPVFSSGLYLGVQGAFRLAAAVAKGSERAMRRYETNALEQIAAWHFIVEQFYNGRLFTSFRVGESQPPRTALGRALEAHFSKHIGRIFSGSAAESAYSLWLLRVACKYGVQDADPSEMSVR